MRQNDYSADEPLASDSMSERTLWVKPQNILYFFKHLLVAQAASQWVTCFSGSLPSVFTWSIIMLCCSRKINMMMMMIY